MRVHVLGRDYDVSVRGFAWEKPEALDAVDGTIEIEVRQSAPPNDDALAFVYGRLSRITPSGPFAIPLKDHLVEIVETVLNYEGDEARMEKGEDGGRLRLVPRRWSLSGGPVEKTAAPDYSILSAPWEALEGTRLEKKERVTLDELCSVYDESTDPFVRFEIMQYALFDYERAEREPWAAWFEKTLRGNLALHGHTVAYWAALDHEPGSVFFDEGSFLWRMMRHIWVESIIPVETVLVPPSSDLAPAGRAKPGEH